MEEGSRGGGEEWRRGGEGGGQFAFKPHLQQITIFVTINNLHLRRVGNIS